MKKNLLLSAGICLSVLLMSWGYVGHQVIAQIAENHLTPQAKLAIKALLGKESIADVASWADEALNQPDYKNTASWHFVNVKPGLSYREFAAAVKGQGSPNVYLAYKTVRTC